MKGNHSHLPLAKVFYSPAKVNLFFRILHKRDDGYHEIVTKMQAISLFDTLAIAPSDKDEYECTDPSLLWDETNLIFKALTLFRNRTGIKTPVSVVHEKTIPLQAGLGGGSSNAATMLYALNTLFSQPLKESEMQTISSTLGADVPFFFSHGTAVCSGIGEKVVEVSSRDQAACTIVMPEYGMSTKEVFSKWKPTHEKRPTHEEIITSGLLHNDLEIPVFSEEPRLKQLKAGLLASGFDAVVMTGSGSSFLCYGKPKGILDPSLRIFPAFHIQRKSHEWYA